MVGSLVGIPPKGNPCYQTEMYPTAVMSLRRCMWSIEFSWYQGKLQLEVCRSSWAGWLRSIWRDCSYCTTARILKVNKTTCNYSWKETCQTQIFKSMMHLYYRIKSLWYINMHITCIHYVYNTYIHYLNLSSYQTHLAHLLFCKHSNGSRLETSDAWHTLNHFA